MAKKQGNARDNKDFFVLHIVPRKMCTIIKTVDVSLQNVPVS